MPSSTSLILLFLTTLAFSKAAKTSFGNDEVTVEVAVNANVPKYTFRATSDPSGSLYHVFFSKIYERKNGNKVGGSNLALPSLDWIISEEANSDTVVFWINGTSKENGGGGSGGNGGGNGNANSNGGDGNGGGGNDSGINGGGVNGSSVNEGGDNGGGGNGGNGGGGNGGGGGGGNGGGGGKQGQGNSGAAGGKQGQGNSGAGDEEGIAAAAAGEGGGETTFDADNNTTGFGGRALQGKSNKTAPFTVLAFRNEIVGASVKFDVFLQDYAWVDAEADSLNLEWRMSNATATDGEDEEPDQEDEEDLNEERRHLQEDLNATEASSEAVSVAPNEICFFGKSANSDRGDAKNQVCWGIEEEAITSDESPVPVALSLQGGFIVVSYQNWGEGDLYHDPQFGFLQGTDFEVTDGGNDSSGGDDPSGGGNDPSDGGSGNDESKVEDGDDTSSSSKRSLQAGVLVGLFFLLFSFAELALL